MSATRIIILVTLFSAAFALFSFGEDYYLNMKSIREIYVDRNFFGPGTFLRINKTGQYKYLVEGCMDFAKTTGPLTAFMHVSSKDYSSNEWKNYAVDQMNLGAVCKSAILKPFFSQYKNSKFDPKCVYEKQITCLDPLDMDAEIHKGMKSAERGCFKIMLKYRVPSSEGSTIEVLEYEIITEIEKINKENEGQANNKRGKKRKNVSTASKCF